ncbi:MAG: hypothetical protein IKB80_02215 [Oscillospiraceae bacterium]|nr:hypothetical protein [Oscillospiraceae bacterium]
MNIITKKTLVLLLAFILLFTCGCGKKNNDSTKPTSNLSKPDINADNIPIETASSEEKEAFANSTPKNDTDVGLRNIKIDTAEAKLTDEQKMIIEYFDDDYLTVPSYEFLRRYPNVYQNAQLNIGGIVKKVISATSDKYTLVLWTVQTEDAYCYRGAHTPTEYQAYLEKNKTSFVVINGKPDSAWFMEGDYLSAYGRYTGIETIEVDGVSYTVPVLDVKKAHISSDIANGVVRFDLSYVKTIAKAIFGDDIEVRNPLAGADFDANQEWRVTDEKPFYLVELENQSNAKFTKYRFYTKDGEIEDAKTGSDSWLLGTDSNIIRNIEFSADFKHFFLFTYDLKLETLTLEYYDCNLNKLWKREFEETTSAIYDYTKNNIYLVANNELYIINIQNGEDTFSSAYIGAKTEIRKLADGVLTIGESKSDAVIKNDLNGKMIWKTNLSSNVSRVNGVQLVDENIILQLQLEDGAHYVVLNGKTGSVIIDAISLS